MKKTVSFLAFFLLIVHVFAQSPEKMSYQAVIRDANNNLVVNHMIGMQISILQGTINGTIVYSETQTPTSNANGFISIEVGGGVVISGTFSTINWASGPYFIKTETDPLGGTNYTITGSSQLLSVPYALHAKTAESIIGGIALLPPTATAEPATNVQSTSVTANGIVNGKGLSSNVEFEWGLTTAYGNSTVISQNPVTGNLNNAVSASLTGLQSSETYHYRIKASNAVNVSYSNDISFTTTSSLSQITTTAISSITGTSATGGGNIINGGTTVTARGVCYNTNHNPSLSNNFTNNGVGGGTFISNINGLVMGTTYYVRAYASNNIGTSYGNELSFTTIALPIVITYGLSAVKGVSAMLKDSVIYNGGSNIIIQGLCWNTSPNPSIANSITSLDTIKILLPNTVYYVRAYASNIAGTAYGNEISFNSGMIIGSTSAGGLVFYNDGYGHGLVCASNDQSTATQWGCIGTTIGGTSNSLNTGLNNTNNIISVCNTAGIAAKLCYDLVISPYSDWFLPSKEELELIYYNLRIQNLGGFSNTDYWSSTENNSTTAVYYNFNYGYSSTTNKDYSHYVRAVRAF